MPAIRLLLRLSPFWHFLVEFPFRGIVDIDRRRVPGIYLTGATAAHVQYEDLILYICPHSEFAPEYSHKCDTSGISCFAGVRVSLRCFAL